MEGLFKVAFLFLTFSALILYCLLHYKLFWIWVVVHMSWTENSTTSQRKFDLDWFQMIFINEI